jgi:YggT family protein
VTIAVQFFSILLAVLGYAILARVILSVIAALAPGNPITSSNNPLAQIILQVTEPILAPMRPIIPTIGMFDFTPLIALLLINVLRSLIQTL